MSKKRVTFSMIPVFGIACGYDDKTIIMLIGFVSIEINLKNKYNRR
jgi:hypothetical protein